MHTTPLLTTLALTSSPQRRFGGRAGPTFTLTDYGAKGDNKTDCTKAFEAGVKAVQAAKGGTLVRQIPSPTHHTTPTIPRTLLYAALARTQWKRIIIYTRAQLDVHM
jgi:hypothetical protein